MGLAFHSRLRALLLPTIIATPVLLSGTLLAVPVFGQASLGSLPEASPTDPIVFDVLRDGSKIGEHRLVFEREEETLKVSVETDMTVKFAFLTVFRYEHKRVERWRDGELESLAGMTNDDGQQYEISIVRKEGHYSRTVNGAEEEISGPVAVDSLWSKQRVTGGKVFSTADDKVYRVRSDTMGTETIEARGGEMQAEHIKLTGELDRDLWYDPAGELLRIRYESDAGETFEFVRR
jgi:hypothetical protein